MTFHSEVMAHNFGMEGHANFELGAVL